MLPRPVCRGATREVRIVIPEDPASVSALLELLELAGRSMHSIGYSEGLYPAQWTALRFFAKAPDGSRTASALARFQGFANGPVSRTVRTLISKGLLQKAEPQPAGRAEHLVITENARSILDHDPTAAIAKVMQGLSESERVALEHALKAVIKTASGVWPRDAKTEPSGKG
jgi:DNA-binding MarR family transcriptional regulator